jgi:glycosyltransferase involved in cell wall biosynthesis
MKVLHVSYSDSNGGAAIGAYRLHHAMLHRGVDSSMLVLHKGKKDPSVTSLITESTKGRIQTGFNAAQDIRNLYGINDLPIRSINLHGLDIADTINQHPAEIVQLHWVANNTFKLSELPKVTKPIVWKMPDMWAFCGGEHYIRHGDIERYKLGYDKTEPFNGENIDVDRLIWEAKKKYYQELSLTITSPSLFLANAAHNSVLLRDYDAHVIPNPLPWDFLTGTVPNEEERQKIRRELKLPADKLIVIFSAFSTQEKRKGYHHIEDMVTRHLPGILPPSKIAFLVCGASQKGVDQVAGYDVFKFSATDDINQYKDFLRAADLLLFPSEMDSTAMVVQEALSQGLPAIVFDVGGLPELVSHKENGYLAEPYNTAKLAAGVEWWVDCNNRETVCANAIERSRIMHNPTKTVERYLNVYETAIKRHRQNQSFKTGKLHKDVPFSPVEELKLQACIIDPSAVNHGDSSHHAEHVLAFAALFEASNIQPHLIINKQASLKNPFGTTENALSWTIYDKLRTGKDQRDGPAIDKEEISRLDESSEKSIEIYFLLKKLHRQYSLSRRDIIVFPTTDRFCVEGVLLFLYSLENHLSPSFHMNIMFEKAEFLLGRYPLERIMHAALRSGYLQKKLFLYAETQQMASDLSSAYHARVRYLAPPHLFQDEHLHAISRLTKKEGIVTNQVLQAYKKATADLPSPSKKDSISIPKGSRVIASLGRGRRDKGWNLLPEIVEAFNSTSSVHSTVFVVQRPRKMDNLEAEEELMEKFSNVILLDEIISVDLLNDICTKADIFLLPYDAGVYHNRGSAFGWRAVLQGKPLVVTENTALMETLLPSGQVNKQNANGDASRFRFFARRDKLLKNEPYLNGKSAKTPAAFAAALADVLKQIENYAAGAQLMRVKYFRTNVSNNPIKATAYKDNFSAQRHTLILESADSIHKAPTLAFSGYAMKLIYSDTISENTAQKPLMGCDGEAPLNFYVQLRDGAIDPEALPEFLTDALSAHRIDSVYAPYEFAVDKGGLRHFPKEWRQSTILY